MMVLCEKIPTCQWHCLMSKQGQYVIMDFLPEICSNTIIHLLFIAWIPISLKITTSLLLCVMALLK